MGITLDLAYGVGAIITSPLWGYRLLRTGKWRTDWAGRFGKVSISRIDAQRPTLLIHAVSVGEVNAVGHLLDELARLRPDLQLVISSTTNTGFDRAVKLYGSTYHVVRFPFDFSFAIKRFFHALRPNAVALVELEVWPNLIAACRRGNIPVAVINGRLSEKSFAGYRRLRPLLGKMFNSLAAVGAQSSDYAQRFAAMGVAEERISILDSMKWDTAQLDDSIDGVDELARQMGIDRSRPLVVLGSTGEGEERMLIDALLQRCDPQVQILIVPRKPERFDEVAAMDGKITRRSHGKPGGEGGRLFLLDTMGELRKAYALGDVVIVGRSFNGWGLSDPIEPVALGKAIIIGPAYQNFARVVEAFVAGDGLVIAADPAEAAEVAHQLLHDEARRRQLAKAGREVILSRQGASRSYAQMLLKLLG